MGATDPIAYCNDTLTHSSEQAFKTCPRMYYWQYELGWRPERDKKPLRMGSAGHVGIDVLAQDAAPAQAVAAVEAVDDFYSDRLAEATTWTEAVQGQYDLAMECETVKCLVAGYATAWAESRVEIIESEKVFNLAIVNPETGRSSRTFRQAGKRDRIGRLPDDRLVLMETKFVGQDITPGSDFWQMAAISSQISKYILAAREDGHNIEGAMYDVVRKPTIKPTPVPLLDEHKEHIVLDRWGKRVYTKQGPPRKTGDANRGFVLQTQPMKPSQWRWKLGQDIKERPDFYYQRREIPRLDADLDEYRHELWWLAEAVRHCKTSGHWFRNCGACTRYNTLCRYYPLCAGEVDTTAGVPAGFRQASVAHEELQQPEEVMIL